MKLKQIFPLVILSLLLVSCSSGERTVRLAREMVSVDSLRNIVEYVASDECQGRQPFTKGADRACDYIASKMMEAGLHPVNRPEGEVTIEDFKQYVPLVQMETGVSPTMEVSGDCQTQLRHLEDFTAFNKRTEPVSIDASLVFAGYGIVAPEYGKDDFKRIENPGGKVAIVIVNDPGLGREGDYFNGSAMTYYGRWTYKFEEGFRQGLQGVLIIHDELGAGYPWSTVIAGDNARYGLDDESNGRGMPLEGWLSSKAARRILASSGLDVDSLLTAAREPSFSPVELNSRVKLSLSNTFTYGVSPNIVGYISGSTDECVVCTAHWDHLGIKSGIAEGDSICNGATDNGTALAWMLETARTLKAAGAVPRRSIVFIAPTTEEKGMWGTEYYVSHPLFPMEKTVAVINKDVLTLWGQCNDETVTGFGYSDMDLMLEKICKKYGRYVTPDPEASNGMFYRSDHLPFMRKGVPAMFAKGWGDSRKYGRDWSKAKINEYWRSIYHTVKDETTDEDDYSGLKEETEIFLDFIWSLADSDYWPTWNARSEFQR